MPDFIYARGTFYATTMEGDAVWVCDSDEATYSFLKADYPEHIHVDGVTIAHQAGDVSIAEKFRAWLKSGG